mgnify:CR=1 FL=1
MANKDFPLRNLLEQGKQLTPSKVKLTFKYKPTYSGCVVKVYGIGRTTTDPVLLNGTTGTVLLGSSSNTGTPLESSQVIELDTNFVVTDLVVRIESYERLAKIRNVVLLARPTDVTPEEYSLTGAEA